MVLPAILDNGTIMLKFGLSLTQLVDLFDVSAGQGDSFQKVQTPVTTGTDDQSTVKLQPGQAMVVTGLSRKVNAGNRRSLADGAPLWLGGSRTLQLKREDFVVVIRAVQF
jgi:Flp pilus assembly secretin CpaC